MPLFDDKVKEQLKGILSKLHDTVNIKYFTQELECGTCKDTHDFLNEISELNDKIKLSVHDFQKDKKDADSYGVDKVPAIVINDSKDAFRGIRFYGLPAGYEINSFIQSLMEVSGTREELPDEVSKRIKAIDKDIHIQVFISLTCPYCPTAVSTAHRLALENDRVTADMVESSTFHHLSIKYDVSSVPKIIINDNIELIGAIPMTEFLDNIEKI